MGVDVQTDPIRVAGCGDMSGDVFGNGMLLSKSIKLVAAFDHRHIFLDPDPDAARSWAERKGATPAQIALAWLVMQPRVITIPMSFDPQHIKENFEAADILLSADEITSHT